MSRFDQKAKEWDGSERRRELASSIAETIIKNVPLFKEMHLLDFGAGTGLMTKHLTPLVKNITALDFSSEMLKKLEENAKSWNGAKVSTVHSDILKYESETQFDGIVSSMSMHHIEDLEALFQKFSTLLRADGFIAIADLDKEDGSFHDDGNEGVHHYGFEQALLTKLAEENGFRDVTFIEAYTFEKENNRNYPVFLMRAYI